MRLREGHFQRWLVLWRETVDELFVGERADLAKAHAQRVARAFLGRLEAIGTEPISGGLTITRQGPDRRRDDRSVELDRLQDRCAAEACRR